MMNRILVMDVGGSSVKYGVMDQESAEILESGSIPTDREHDGTAEEKRQKFIGSLADLFEQYPACEGVAMSIPGTVDTRNGSLTNPGALWFNLNAEIGPELREEIERRTGRQVKVTLENDGKAAALAELWKGNLQGVEDGVVMTLGTGIGGGLIAGGRLLRGNGFSAGELSWLPSNHQDIRMETMAAMGGSITAMVAAIAEASGEDPLTFDGRQAMALVESQDAEACRIFDETMSHLAAVCYAVNCVLNPQRICFGGGISRQPLVVKTIEDKFNQIVDSLAVPQPKPEFTACRFFSDSNLIGALYHYNQMGS